MSRKLGMRDGAVQCLCASGNVKEFARNPRIRCVKHRGMFFLKRFADRKFPFDSAPTKKRKKSK